ncbi:hypothetical protein HAX54_000345 [Datura stramonium]|uniref:Uncharacterized protein n=1 Tax=Datura stramonium TaxID=4076 RepID=A0ABS8T1J7_DATST|nr:hypothetical protein [Datura stramonium]
MDVAMVSAVPSPKGKEMTADTAILRNVLWENINLNVQHFSFRYFDSIEKRQGNLKKKQGFAVQTHGILNYLKTLDFDLVDWSQQQPEIRATGSTLEQVRCPGLEIFLIHYSERVSSIDAAGIAPESISRGSSL